MATKKRRKARSGVEPTAWEQFAAVSRGVVSSREAPSTKAARAKPRTRRRHGVAGTQNATQATAQALRLGQKQAEWVVARHNALQQRRAKVVAAKGPARAG